MSAREAERIGLVSQVVPSAQLIPAAQAMADRISSGAPCAIKGIKELTYGSMEWAFGPHIEETRRQLQETSASEDSKEGVRSFLERRPPVWKGR